MPEKNQGLVPVFIPMLSAVLQIAEDEKGEPLTCDEVFRIRDKSPCIMMATADAMKMIESRGYDIDPENCWYDWQHLRRHLGRKPDLDPGPRLGQIHSSDPDYQRTIHDARESLDRFRAMLPIDGSGRREAMVKTEINEGNNRAFMWLSNTRRHGRNFVAKFFEVPVNFTLLRIGDELEIADSSVLDWMVNDDGVLYGGFSLRYQRALLPEDERESFDDYIGVTKYA